MIRRTALWFVVTLGMVVAWQTATVYANYKGDWSALFYTGDFLQLPPQVAAEQPYRFPRTPGFDGAFYHMLAHAPSMPPDTRASIDNPPLRWRRILVPSLAYGAAFGDQERVDFAYIAVVDVWIALGAAALALFLRREGIHPAWSLLFPLVPAALVSMDRMTVDAALAALVVLFAIANGPLLWIAAALGPLVRETGWVLVAAYVVMTWRRPWPAACGRSIWTFDSQAKPPAPPVWLNELGALVGQAFSLPDFFHRLLALTAAIPGALWYAWVQYHTSPDRTAWLSAIPFRGLIGRTLDIFPVQPHTAWERIALSLDYLAVFGIWAAIAVVIWMARDRDTGRLAIIAYLFAVTAIFVSKPDVWQDAYAFARTQSPLLICCALWGIAQRRWIALAPVVLTLPRLLFQLEPQAKGIL
jgi:hypothetical protein